MSRMLCGIRDDGRRETTDEDPLRTQALSIYTMNYKYSTNAANSSTTDRRSRIWLM